MNALQNIMSVSYTHLRAHETVLDLVCRLLLEKKTPILIYYLCWYMRTKATISSWI